MKLSINLFDLVKFENLRDGNEYLQKSTSYANGMWFIDVNDTKRHRVAFKKRID